MDVLFQESTFDNNLSSLYKRSLSQNIPIRYMIIQNKSGSITQLSGALSLQDPNLQFISVFQYVRNKLIDQPSLTLEEIREDLREISGGEFNDLDIIWIWLTVLAQDNKLNDPTLLQQINSYLNSIKEPKQFDSINAVYSEYTNIWRPAFQREVSEDLRVLQKYTENQQELLKTEPVINSGLRINSAVVYLEYSTEVDVNPLPDIFSSAKNSYLIPFIQYNIESVKGKESKAQRYYKIFHGKSSELNPDYANVLVDTSTFLQDHTIYMGIWIGPASAPGNEEEEQNQARLSDKKSFQEASISYDAFANKIRITIDSPRNENVNELVLLKRLQAHFPSLGSLDKLGSLSNFENLELKEAKVSGSFEMYGTETNEPFFSYLIMNDPIFSAYLFLNDKTKTFPLKKNFEVYYRGTTNKLSKSSEIRQKSGALVAAILTQKIIPSGTIISYVSGNGQRGTYSLPADTISVEVIIKRANSRKIAEQFLNVLTRLNRIYLNKGSQIRERYRAFIPEYDPTKNLEKQITSGMATTSSIQTDEKRVTAQRAPDAIVDPKNTLPIPGDTKLKRLKAYAPDLFKKEYARDCQRPRQPEPVRPENVAFYRNQQITVDGRVEFREVLEVLNLDKTAYYYFICEPVKDIYKHPYPHLKANTDPNKVYEQVPCCFSKRPTIPTASKAHRNTAKKGYRNKGSKPIDSGKEGELEIKMSDFFKPAAASDESEFIRMGIPFGTNSFLHCLFVATQHPEYYASPDQDEYVNQFRQKLFSPGLLPNNQALRPELARQELYDFTLAEIQNQATNNDIFFDPLKFYRLIEVLFNCTVYIFTQKDRGLDGLKINFLRIPRHKHFHVKPPPNLDHSVVLINLNWSSKTNRLYPHCELIVEKSDFGTRRLFKKKMNRLLYPAYEFVARTLTWQILDSGMINRDENPALTLRENIYSKMNYQIIFGEIPVVAQFIDSAGKARMFALAPEVDPAQNTYTKLRIFVEVPPTAPLNVIEFKPKDISQLLPPVDKVIELFGEPVSITTDTAHTQITGVWFRMNDLEFGLYCPCSASSLNDFLQEYPGIRQNSELDALTIRIPRNTEGGMTAKEVSPLQQFRLLRRAANFVSQILKYLYLVEGEPDINKFLSSYLIGRSPNDTRSSFQIYAQNISKLQRILPIGTTQQILAQLHQQIPDIVVNTGMNIGSIAGTSAQLNDSFRIVVNDRKMLEGIIYQLRSFKQHVEGLNIPSSKLRELQNYYTDRDDYFFDPDSQFLISSQSEFEAWKNAYILSNSQQKRVLQELRDNIQTTINKENYSYQTPYIYQQSGNNVVNASYDPSLDHFYLIQNVAGSNFDRAIAAALNWKKKMENSGFSTDPYRPVNAKYPVHKIYGINPSGKIILNTDNSQDQDNYLEILIYDDQRYAAMLPLS